MKADLIINASTIACCTEGKGAGIIEGGYIAVKNGRIIELGKGNAPVNMEGSNTRIINAYGKTVTPGLIDSHTHLIHGGSREKELPLKLKGVPYLEILKMGGGILSTVRSTRSASKEELKSKAEKSLDRMLLHGTTTVEAKSGYGLDFDTEIKCLEAAAELNASHPVDIVSTYMGAHAVPEEFKGNTRGYMGFMFEKVMPYIRENNLAEYIDVFCEEGVFSPEESRIIMQKGKEEGFKLKIHADEIVPLQGAELAGEMGAVSAEHLLAASDEGIAAMAEAGTTAILLPGTSFYLMLGKYAQARKMMEKGVRVAIATDYNPGTCPTENLQSIMTFACFGMKMTPEEIIKGMTLNAAYGVDKVMEIGSLEAGKKADMVIFDAPNLEYIIYHFGINHVSTVIKNGETVVENGMIIKNKGIGR
ncbi:MAG TPA: imidazolonepropionase [Bacillota bacterium]|nr:imidazolonepropionase [Bacillota bacterium]HPL53091.1 imidazolonepropionase [Bacillota bacterium]